MGTSNSNAGPNGSGPLLPPGAPLPPIPLPEPDDESEETNSSETDSKELEPSTEADQVTIPPLAPVTGQPWQDAKRDMSNYARTRQPEALKRSIRHAIRAQGGVGGAMVGSGSGASTARNLGGLLSSISNVGASETARAFNLRYVGRNVSALMAALIDAVAPAGNFDEEAISRSAAAETLQQLFDRFSVGDDGLATLENLTPNAIFETVRNYVANYINKRLMLLLGFRVESKSITPTDAFQCERDVKDYVTEKVKLEFSQTSTETFEWMGRQGRQLIDRIFLEGYRLMGAS